MILGMRKGKYAKSILCVFMGISFAQCKTNKKQERWRGPDSGIGKPDDSTINTCSLNLRLQFDHKAQNGLFLYDSVIAPASPMLPKKQEYSVSVVQANLIEKENFEEVYNGVKALIDEKTKNDSYSFEAERAVLDVSGMKKNLELPGIMLLGKDQQSIRDLQKNVYDHLMELKGKGLNVAMPDKFKPGNFQISVSIMSRSDWDLMQGSKKEKIAEKEKVISNLNLNLTKVAPRFSLTAALSPNTCQ